MIALTSVILVSQGMTTELCQGMNDSAGDDENLDGLVLATDILLDISLD